MLIPHLKMHACCAHVLVLASCCLMKIPKRRHLGRKTAADSLESPSLGVWSPVGAGMGEAGGWVEGRDAKSACFRSPPSGHSL